jgi:hypothetical protein
VVTPREEQFCAKVIFKFGSPNKQTNQLTDEAKSKHISMPASQQASNQPTNNGKGSFLKTQVIQSRNSPYINEPEESLLSS